MKTNKLNSKKLFLLGLVLIGLLFRGWLALTLPPWIDEVFTLNHIQLPFSVILKGHLDPPHPFGYYFFIKLWSLFSQQLVWLRLSSLIFYVFNSLLLWKISQKSDQKYYGIFLIILYVFSGYFIIFDWQSRMYTGTVTLMLSSWYALLKKKPITFSLLNIVGLYFDYAFLWYMLPLTMFIGYRFWQKKKVNYAILNAMLFSWSIFSIWTPLFFSNFSNGINGINWNAKFINPAFFIPYFLGVHENLILTLLFLLIFLSGTYIVFKIQKNITSRFFIFSGITSGLMSLIASTLIGPIFHVRNLQIVGLAILISSASFCSWLWKKNEKISVAIILLIFIYNFIISFKLHFISPGILLLKF